LISVSEKNIYASPYQTRLGGLFLKKLKKNKAERKKRHLVLLYLKCRQEARAACTRRRKEMSRKET